MKHARRSRNRLPAVLAVAGLACVGVVVTHQSHAPAPPLTPAGLSLPAPPPVTRLPQTPLPPRAAEPRRLLIPSIGVQTDLIQLGRTSAGALEVPAPGPHYNQAGWYRYSPTPGSLGPAVIVGHVDAKDGPSVFFRLGSLRGGDRVMVLRADRTTAVFRVDAVARYRKDAFPLGLVYGNTDHPALRLITCGGPFDSSTGHYRDNVVVSASLTTG
jgi:hypothetical protein